MNGIPKRFLQAMVKIGIPSVPGLDSYEWQGTGFLLLDERFLEVVFLVSNKHVIADLQSLSLDFALKGSHDRMIFQQAILENGTDLWIGHEDPEIDLAIVPISRTALDRDGIDYQAINIEEIVTVADLQKADVSEGAEVLSLSFPIGIIAEEEYPYARKGIISQIQGLYNNESNFFIIDVYVFPGNSGGPVFVVYSLKDELEVQIKLIGILRGYLSYVEEAVSRQTNNTRIIFEDNAGLSSVEAGESLFRILEQYKTEVHDKKI